MGHGVRKCVYVYMEGTREQGRSNIKRLRNLGEGDKGILYIVFAMFL